MTIIRDVPMSGEDYVDSNGVLHMGSTGGGVQVRNATDVANLPTSYAPGKMAHTPGWKIAWEKSATGGWANITGGEDVGV